MQQIKSVEDMYATAKALSDEMRNRGLPHWCFESLADITQFAKIENKRCLTDGVADTRNGVQKG